MISNTKNRIEQKVSSNGEPKDLEIEKCFLASLILDQSNIELSLNLDIDNSHFYDTRNQLIYDAIVAIKYNDGCDVDPVLIKNKIQTANTFRHYTPKEIALFLIDIESQPIIPANFYIYAKGLEDYKQKRALARKCKIDFEKAHDRRSLIDTDCLTHRDNIKRLDIAKCLTNDPPPLKWVFQGFLPSGIIGSLNASGGTSKSYLALYLAVSEAAGMQIFRCFKPVQPRSVICWFGEDAENILWERLRNIVDSYRHLNLELLKENLNIFCEQSNPLMELDMNNPVVTKSYLWLKHKIKELNPGLVIIDPKSKFFGLDEINNSHAAIWLSKLQELLTPDVTILVIHHVNKSGATLFDSASARGASAFVDGCRWAASMRIMDKETGAKYDIDNHRTYVELLVTKSNYTILRSEPLRFRHMEGGGMEQVDVDRSRHGDIAVAIQEALKNNPDKLVSENEIIRLPAGKFIRDYIKEYHSKVSRIDIKNAIDHGLQAGILHQLEILSGTKTKQIIST